MADVKGVHITRLIAIPAVITLAVTILRLVGELEHWTPALFNTAAGGGGALVGISWLPIIFGPYFALKLTVAGDGPQTSGKAIGFAFLALAVYILALALFVITVRHPSLLTLAAFLLMLIAGFVPLPGWRSLGRVLLAYAFAARLPVLIVMYLAMTGNGGAGWGTHYDAVNPLLAHLSFGRKYFYAAILPQLTMWIGWTAILGSIFGALVAAIAGRGKQAAPAAG